ncbi:MAG: hypothetical protein D6813_07220 [Calditrichaeota bacterium]|nr:MAG: hypothetical protein D6813_07220 [Calditrichota bacterium]
MMGKKKFLGIFVLIFLIYSRPISCKVYGQLPEDSSEVISPINLRYLYLGHWAYRYIDLLQERGYLKELLRANRPYKRSQIIQAITELSKNSQLSRTERYWVKLLRDEFLNPKIIKKDNLTFYGEVVVDQDGFQRQNDARVDYFVSGELVAALKNIVAVNRTFTDNKLKRDPFFLGRKDKLLTGRVNDAYGLVSFDRVDLFFGRLDRNWTPSAGKRSLILSRNPYSYDHLFVQFHSKRLSLSFMAAKLDNVPYITQEGEIPQTIATKYLSVHRVDIYPFSALQIGLTEAAIYGGPGRRFEFSFLNPFNIFFEVAQNDQDTKLEGANGLWAVDIFLQPTRRWSLAGQFLIDDIILNDRANEDFRSQFPDRLAYALQLNFNDFLIKNTLTQIEYRKVGNWTYQSARLWESYLSRLKGIGEEQNDFDRWTLEWTAFPIPKWIFKFRFTRQRAGEGDIRAIFFPVKKPFPSGIVETQTGSEFSLYFQPSRFFNARIFLGIDRFRNFQHVSGNRQTFFNFGLSVSLQRGFFWEE